MNMPGRLVRCVCGLLHIAEIELNGVPVIACPDVPYGDLWTIDTRYVRPLTQLKIPRPEQVW